MQEDNNQMFIMSHSKARGETRLYIAKHRLDQDPGRLRLGSASLVYNPHAHVTKSIRVCRLGICQETINAGRVWMNFYILMFLVPEEESCITAPNSWEIMTTFVCFFLKQILYMRGIQLSQH